MVSVTKRSAGALLVRDGLHDVPVLAHGGSVAVEADVRPLEPRERRVGVE